MKQVYKNQLSSLFTRAHQLAKLVIKSGDSYQATFGACVKLVREADAGYQVARTKDAMVKHATKYYALALQGVDKSTPLILEIVLRERFGGLQSAGLNDDTDVQSIGKRQAVIAKTYNGVLDDMSLSPKEFLLTI